MGSVSKKSLSRNSSHSVLKSRKQSTMGSPRFIFFAALISLCFTFLLVRRRAKLFSGM